MVFKHEGTEIEEVLLGTANRMHIKQGLMVVFERTFQTQSQETVSALATSSSRNPFRHE